MTLLAILLALSSAQPSSQASDARATLQSPSPIRVATICPEGLVVAAGDDRNLYVWMMMNGGKLLGSISASQPVSIVSCSPDGRWIAAGMESGVVMLIDARTRKIVRQLAVTKRLLNTMAFAPDSSLLAVCPDDGPAQIWNVATGTRIATLQPTVGGSIGVAFSPDSTQLATADEDTHVRLYDRRGQLVRALDFGLLAPFGVAFAADGSQVVAAGVDRMMTVFEIASGRVVKRSERQPDLIWQVTRLPGDQQFAVLQMDEFTLLPTTLTAWDAASGEFRSRQQAADVVGTSLIGGGTAMVVISADKDRKTLGVRPFP